MLNESNNLEIADMLKMSVTNVTTILPGLLGQRGGATGLQITAFVKSAACESKCAEVLSVVYGLLFGENKNASENASALWVSLAENAQYSPFVKHDLEYVLAKLWECEQPIVMQTFCRGIVAFADDPEVDHPQLFELLKTYTQHQRKFVQTGAFIALGKFALAQEHPLLVIRDSLELQGWYATYGLNHTNKTVREIAYGVLLRLLSVRFVGFLEGLNVPEEGPYMTEKEKELRVQLLRTVEERRSRA